MNLINRKTIAVLAGPLAFLLIILFFHPEGLSKEANAIVFSSGHLKIPDMVRTGFWMNIISIILLTIFVYFILPHLWGFEPKGFPLNFE